MLTFLLLLLREIWSKNYRLCTLNMQWKLLILLPKKITPNRLRLSWKWSSILSKLRVLLPLCVDFGERRNLLIFFFFFLSVEFLYEKKRSCSFKKAVILNLQFFSLYKTVPLFFKITITSHLKLFLFDHLIWSSNKTYRIGSTWVTHDSNIQHLRFTHDGLDPI